MPKSDEVISHIYLICPCHWS